MATEKEKQLAITLLKERIEFATGKKVVLKEKWDKEVEVKEPGKYKGWTLEKLRAAHKTLKDKKDRTATESGKLKELNFAIRAKTGWGKVKESVVKEDYSTTDIEPLVRENTEVQLAEEPVKKDKNKEAYDGLKKIGHNWATEPYDPKLDYTKEWEENKNNPDLLDEKAVSKAQQRFFGVANAMRKGEMKPAGAAGKLAKSDISTKDIKDFASTKHKGLPNKVKKESAHDKLKIALLKEKIEKITGQKIILKEMGLMSKKKVEPETIESDLTPEGAQVRLRKAISEYARKDKLLSEQTKKFYDKIDKIQQTITDIEGNIPGELDVLKDEILSHMKYLGKSTEVVGKTIASYEQRVGNKTPSYKGMVEAIRALQGFMDTYGNAMKEIEDKYQGVARIIDDINITKTESVITESTNKVVSVLKSIFKSIKDILTFREEDINERALEVEQKFMQL